MFRFVTIIPLELWAIVLLLLFMWAALGLNGFLTPDFHLFSNWWGR